MTGSQIMREVSILPEELTDTVVFSIVTRLPAGLRNSDSIPNSGKRILPSHASKLALYPAQPPVQWVPTVCVPEQSVLDVNLTNHLLLVPGIRMSGAIPPLPRASS